VEIDCGGFPPKEVFSRSRPSFILWLVMRVGASLGRVWRTQTPPRSVIFAWSGALGKILTLDNLKKRHVIVINRCCMCKRSEETVDHLLLHCEVASTLWYAIFSRFGMAWVMPRRVFDLLACWWSSGRRRSVVV
jgi:hypothetical protein